MSESKPTPTLPDFDAMWDYPNPSESERRFREVLPAAEASGNAGGIL